MSKKEMYKIIEASINKLSPSQDPLEFLEVSFKNMMVEMFVNAMDTGMVPNNRLSMDHYKTATANLITEFRKIKDVPDKCKVPIRVYEQWRDEVMKGIAHEAKRNKGRDTAQVKTMLDVNIKEHNRLQQTKSGIILPPGVKV